MKLRLAIQFHESKRASAFSLVEMLVAVGIGVLILNAVIIVFSFSNYSFAAMGNYMELDKQSRNAIDLMTRDIRGTKSVQSYAPNRMVFVDNDESTLTFDWDSSTKILTRTKAGESKVLLTKCDYLRFDIFQRNPIPNVFEFVSASNSAALTKLVDVRWVCSRDLLKTNINTESVQTAKIVIRN